MTLFDRKLKIRYNYCRYVIYNLGTLSYRTSNGYGLIFFFSTFLKGCCRNSQKQK